MTILSRTGSMRKLGGTLHSLPGGYANHVSIHFDGNGSSFEKEANNRPLRRAGNNRAAEPGKRTEGNRDYCAFGHCPCFAGLSLR